MMTQGGMCGVFLGPCTHIHKVSCSSSASIEMLGEFQQLDLQLPSAASIRADQ